MTKKSTAILIVIILILGALSFGGYKVFADITSKKKAQQEIMINMIASLNYQMQYKAFYGISFDEYRPYDKRFEYELQTRIIYYTKKTEKTITLEGVETFLATQYNPDGTSRTWEDDETGIIKDYVDWCGYNADELDNYRDDLSGVLTDYVRMHPECRYYSLSKLTPKQIIELGKKQKDENYQLVLE